MTFIRNSFSYKGKQGRWDVLILPYLQVALFVSNFDISNNFSENETCFILGMHVYFMKLHIMRGDTSRSSFKVKGKIYRSNHQHWAKLK